MVDPLNAWWAQQLVLCDWAFMPDPLTLPEEAALERLAAIEVVDRGELAWRLLELDAAGHASASQLLASLELIALGGAAGWLTADVARSWAVNRCREIQRRYDSLDDWLEALCEARGREGWLHGDEGLLDACRALSKLEGEGAGITWSLLEQGLAQASVGPLWPDSPEDRVWRLRAAFSPVLVTPASQHDWQGVDTWLAEVWQIHCVEDLERALLWLTSQGDRQGWDIDASRLMSVSTAERQAWCEGLGPQERAYGRLLCRYIDQGEPLEWAAWDWLRAVDLAWAGACMGWLSPSDAALMAYHAADLVQRRYSDWSALARSYQRGRGLFEGQDRLPSLAADWQWLMGSPLSPWQDSLAELLDEGMIEASREAARGFRLSPRHWVLALASVREPELAARQGPPPTLVQSRRDEARKYLVETLDLHPDEGARALVRYWLPAQAHHLNQLAADAAHRALPSARTPFGDAPAGDISGRDGLAKATRHSATIHMAEKYAFYLLMSMDSEQFDAASLEEMAAALRDVLCRFYSSPKRLLEAWATWDSLLPEPEQPTLSHEIRWHLDDPGSLFHWLTWQGGDWREPGERPSLMHFTALSLVGPLNTASWSLPQPESDREGASIRDWIDGHYGLHTATELIDFVRFLLDVGDRQEYQINYAPYTLNAARLNSEIATLESGECNEEERNHLLRLLRVRDNADHCNDIDMCAWDLAQAVDLAIAGRQLGWLAQPDFLALLERAYQLASTHYAGWQDFARGLYAGFSFFMGETPERESFLASFRQALIAWLSGAPPLAGTWASLDFPGARPRHWAPLHIDTLPGDGRTLH
ncbi:DUF1266 domain-containing protein [Halomonas denitrificans]|uniref:DUF1266 domain-containing protein n=1 Tax=Halomonas denitrificans TaxID=370769 RepID=UPI001CD5F2E9|nr:DUF1266 domain-containing protein [Halomonas denitrificans]MCA0972919.1 DUF1266 domain-containing protein [Halomonas denitrificans]